MDVLHNIFMFITTKIKTITQISQFIIYLISLFVEIISS